MRRNLFRASALLIAVLMLLTCFAGCKKKKQQVPDLPVITSDPYAIATFVPGTDDNVKHTPAPTEEATEEPTEEPTAAPTPAPTPVPTAAPTECPVREDGQYNTKDEVALYIHLFGHLPSNYITKREATSRGWTGGSLEPYAPGCSIGGDRFGNYEGILPKKQGRTYTECDIGTKGKSSRGAKRIVFSNDGLIYYTGDHYETFTLLYGGDD